MVLTKYAIRIVSLGLFIGGVCTLTILELRNRELRASVTRLEAELGRMSIDDGDRVHLVAIENPALPPEVARHIDHVWQFRCYLPTGYHFLERSTSGRVAKDGLYTRGGFGSGWSSPSPEPTQKLLTVSLKERENDVECFMAFGGSSTTTSWKRLLPESGIPNGLVVETLVAPGGPARSFDPNAILPIIKVYDPTTAKEEQVEGRTLTTFAGGMILFCPKSREAALEELRHGRVPEGFEADWIARGGQR